MADIDINININQMREAIVADGTYNGYKYDIMIFIAACCDTESNPSLQGWITENAKQAYNELTALLENRTRSEKKKNQGNLDEEFVKGLFQHSNPSC